MKDIQDVVKWAVGQRDEARENQRVAYRGPEEDSYWQGREEAFEDMIAKLNNEGGEDEGI